MTEQEKREKAIEEMAKDLELSCDDNENNNHSDCSEWSDCNKCQARYLIEKCHYRKEEEVQKETARKFLQLWYDDMFNAGECVGHIEKLAKEMGVKIDVFGAEVD